MQRLQQVINYNQKLKSVPFGYQVTENGSIIVLEDDAMLVREIYRLFLLYKSYNMVSKNINSSENFPDHPYTFTPKMIESILHNIFYAGHLVTTENDSKEVVLPFNHKGIVPNEIWNLVQTLK